MLNGREATGQCAPFRAQEHSRRRGAGSHQQSSAERLPTAVAPPAARSRCADAAVCKDGLVEHANQRGERWHLEDAEERHNEAVRSFFIPASDVRSGLRPGDVVKLLFVLEVPLDGDWRVERMWVQVTATNEGCYVGRLLNEPETDHVLSVGAELSFGPEHVAAIALDRDDLGYDPDQAIAVSAAALDADAPPGELFWEPAADDRDSGWQAFVGNESAAYLDDADHCRMPNLGWFAERHPQIEIALRDPRPGRWVWDAAAGTYRHAGGSG